MKTNTILIIIASVVVVLGAYWFYFSRTSEEPALSIDAPTSAAQTQFETLARQLPISFNTSIFSDARFNALVDITVPITPEPAGRLDPLAPIPGMSGH